MLVLRRKIGESIEIAGGIRITVLAIENGRIKIGVDAPRSVTILRSEVEDRDAQPRGKERIA